MSYLFFGWQCNNDNIELYLQMVEMCGIRTVKFWDLEAMQLVCTTDGDCPPVRYDFIVFISHYFSVTSFCTLWFISNHCITAELVCNEIGFSYGWKVVFSLKQTKHFGNVFFGYLAVVAKCVSIFIYSSSVTNDAYEVKKQLLCRRNKAWCYKLLFI